jgi:hypothetical protein
MTDTMPAVLVQGHDDLEVVGESHYQAELWRLLGGRGRAEVRVRMDIHTVLVAIQVLRTALASETHVIGRHFIYAEGAAGQVGIGL